MILVFGRSGQVAQALKTHLAPHDVMFVGRQDADFSNPQQCLTVLDRVRPRLVINAAAYTAVDRAETERDLCRQLNAITPIQIGDWCKKNETPFIHFSSDYVFDGKGETPYKEESPFAPVNWYGATKAEADRALLSLNAKILILRVSWVYSSTGSNFVKTILRLAQNHDELRIVSDQIGGPTSADDIAQSVLSFLPQLSQFQNWGAYHYQGRPWCSWSSFAAEILFQAQKWDDGLSNKRVVEIRTVDFPTAAKRPANSRLDTTKFERVFGQKVPDWKFSLQSCLKEIYANP
ncbi:MAG: dTDP-4-dehydrorhamnose reductase [Bdellovibrio sp.]